MMDEMRGHPDIIVKLGEDSTLRELQSAVQQRTGIPPQQQIFKSGFPPTVVDILPGQRIGEVFPNRSSVIVEQGIPRREAVEDGDEKALEQGTSSKDPKDSAGAGARPTPLHWRKVPDDNSCLFHAVSIGVGQGYNADKLREVAATVVLSDPDSFSEAFLGLKNETYVEKILQPHTWGGAIELSIFSKFFKVEIAAIDVETLKIYRYGEDSGFEETIYLLFNGIHYDVLTDKQGGSEKTRFRSDDPIPQQRAFLVAKEAQAGRQFTNLGSFTLRCDVCREGFVGADTAREHASQTGHQNFSEYHENK